MANISAVLEKVNAGRVACGQMPLYDLPRGAKGSKTECPVARALKDALPGIGIGSTYATGVKRDRAAAFAAAIGGSITEINGTAKVSLPPEIRGFVRDFDAGYHSAYRI